MGVSTLENYNISNVYEFIVSSKSKLNKIKEKLEKPGLTEDYLKECQSIAEKYKKPSK